MKRRVIRGRLATLSASLLAVAAWVAASASPAGAVPLTGEQFTGTTITANCDTPNMPFNGGGAFSFHITGDATGPYTGSFTEDGTGSSTQGFDGPLTAFHATFTINSITPPAVITGTKDLAPGSLSAGQCTPPIYSVQFLNYQAVTPDCVDQGTSDLSFVSDPDPTFFHRFSESFVSLACTPPTNKKCAQATAHADKQCSQHGSDSKQCVKARREQEAAC